MSGPFFIAMVDPGTEYDAGVHHVEDEVLDYMKIEHVEGQIPTLTIRFQNPFMGPLNPARKTGIIVSWETGGTDGIIPLFVGQLMAIPSDIVANAITYVYHAKHTRYDENLRLLADSMRHLPEYDEIFIDFDKRDDPDVVLEGYSKLWHVDRVTNEITASDVLDGEDGIEVFTEGDQLDHSKLTVEIDQSLLPNVTCVMQVKWTQAHTGTIDTGSRAFASFGGEALVSSWPKAGADIGGGWSAAVAGANDTSAKVSEGNELITYQATYTNKAKKHHNGDTMSVNRSDALPAPGVTATEIKNDVSYFQTGLIDPFAVDDEGNPAPKMIPMELRGNKTWIQGGPGGNGVNTSLVVRYDAARDRSETLSFQVDADLQPFPVSAGQGETITLNGADVGEPFVRLETWSDVAGEAVSLGQMIFPSYIGFPGSRIAMRATTAGTAGTVLPDFPETAGDTVADGTVVWTSLGVVNPNSSSAEWSSEIDIEAGTILLPRVSDNVPTYAMLVQSGLLAKPQTGTDVDEDEIIRAANGSYQVCTVGGLTERLGAPSGGAFFSSGGPTVVLIDTIPVEPDFSATWGEETVDGSVVWTSLGTTLPNGMNQYIAIGDGVTGIVMPAFPADLGDSVVDGTVTWVNIGVAQIPMGGTPGNVPNASYFPTDRGQQSIQYGMCVTRAKLRYRSRMVKISNDIPFIRAAMLSCRKSATIAERRLPGGEATGKVMAYFMEVDGASGAARGGITIGCSIGAGTGVTAADGDPVYAEPGYAEPGWQLYENAIIVLPNTADMAYTPPVARTVDDGLTFPLTKATGVLRQQVVGTIQTQLDAALAAIEDASETLAGSGEFPLGLISPSQPTLFEITISGQQTAAEKAAQANAEAIAQMVADNPYYYELQFPNVTNGPFNCDYSLTVTPATLPRQIDLEAA
jgi:hypothetical protein